MLVKVLKSKLHRARVTECKLHYPGSIAIDSTLMEAVGIVPYESVLVADLDTGRPPGGSRCSAPPLAW